MGEEMARIMVQVIPPVSSAMPDPQVVDMDMVPAGAEPETTMGPGQPDMGLIMPALFAETEEQ